VDYDGEHHAGMGNGTHNLLIGGHESLPPSQGPWCLKEETHILVISRLDGNSPEVHSHLKFENNVSDTCLFKKKLYLTLNCFHFIGGKMRSSPKRLVTRFWNGSQDAVRHRMVV
jgi:hypothetical protein